MQYVIAKHINEILNGEHRAIKAVPSPSVRPDPAPGPIALGFSPENIFLRKFKKAVLHIDRGRAKPTAISIHPYSEHITHHSQSESAATAEQSSNIMLFPTNR
jgi:hypothetical protein